MDRRRWTDLQLACAVAESRTLTEVCRKLRLFPGGANYEHLKRHISRLGLDTSHFRRLRRAPHWPEDEAVVRAVAESKGLAEVMRKLGMHVGSSSYRWLHDRIADLGVDTSHFVGPGWRKGSTTSVVPPRPLEEILVAGRPFNNSNLRRRLLREGLKDHRCEICGNTHWNGRRISLELDHINGDRSDNRLENLRLISPNCHAQTATYRGRNIGRWVPS